MPHTPREIAFVINNLPDAKTLLDAIPASTTVHLLDAHGDALAQMATLLADEQGLDAIHLFSHGSQGTLNLGTRTLDQTTLNHHATTPPRWPASALRWASTATSCCMAATWRKDHRASSSSTKLPAPQARMSQPRRI